MAERLEELGEARCKGKVESDTVLFQLKTYSFKTNKTKGEEEEDLVEKRTMTK